jgi:hypothetical protein
MELFILTIMTNMIKNNHQNTIDMINNDYI